MNRECKSIKMFTRIEPSTLKLLGAAAKKAGTTRSAFVRKAIIQAAKETLSLDAKSPAA